MISDIGKMLVTVGTGILLLGGLLWLSGGPLKNSPIGRLPGDILIQNDRFTLYFPFTTGILFGLVLTGFLWLGRLLARR
jgi:hypothetical protein